MIVKNANRGRHTNAAELLYVYISDPNMNIYSAVRDWILPHTHIFLKKEENGDFTIIPTNSEKGYKLSIHNGKTSVSARALICELGVKTRVRIPCEKLPDGTILCKSSSVR